MNLKFKVGQYVWRMTTSKKGKVTPAAFEIYLIQIGPPEHKSKIPTVRYLLQRPVSNTLPHRMYSDKVLFETKKDAVNSAVAALQKHLS